MDKTTISMTSKESLEQAVVNDIAYLYSVFVPEGTENVMQRMKRDIWPADRKYLDYTERTQAGIRFTCPYDILMNRLRSRITDFYDKLTPAQQALEAFGQFDEPLKKIAGQFQKQWEASKNATVKAVLREMDLQIMQNKDAKAVISHMSNVLKKRMASQAQLLQAATGQLQQYMVLWKYQDTGCTHYRFYAEGENCADCAELHGRVFPISEALSGTNFPPMHPNCNCRAEILDAQGNAVYTVSGGAEAATLHQPAWYDGLLRIPQDAKELLTGLIRSQDERFWNIQDPLTLLDWLTFGMLSTNGQRAVVAQQNPNFYTIGNWLTMGLFDTVKGAFQPEEPFSLQHWLDSFGTASLLISAYSMAKAAAPSAGTVNYADDAAAVAVKKAGDALDDVPAGRKGAAGSGTITTVDDFIDYYVNPNFQQSVKDAFMSDARVTVLEENATVYRYYGGTSSGNSYWYTPIQTSNPAADLALPQGNVYQYMDTFIVPKGTTILEGTVAPNFGQPGGGYQYYIPDPSVVIKQ